MSAVELFAVVVAFAALVYSVAWLLAWVLVCVSKNVVGAVTESVRTWHRV